MIRAMIKQRQRSSKNLNMIPIQNVSTAQGALAINVVVCSHAATGGVANGFTSSQFSNKKRETWIVEHGGRFRDLALCAFHSLPLDFFYFLLIVSSGKTVEESLKSPSGLLLDLADCRHLAHGLDIRLYTF